MTDLLKQNGIQLWPEEKIIRFRKALLTWYDVNKRDLPWRRTQDPYAIWVSEIMLQQTQVGTVIPYYIRFMEWFPTIASLANAPENLLLKAWEGLGYYSRVKNMQIAAKQMVSSFQGHMPSTLEEIRTLKGIGPYTAGAIASIAFNLPTPAVDGNVMRVMARLFEIKLDIGEAKNRKVFEALVSALIDPVRPGDFNQALMDLGSDICSAHQPKPEISPIREFNAAYQNGTMAIYPIKEKKVKVKNVYYQAIVYTNETGDYFLQQRNSEGLLANMWTFPLIELDKASYDTYPKANIIGSITHLFSHRKWHIHVVLAKKNESPTGSGNWISQESISLYPTPTPQVKMFAVVDDYLNKSR